MEILLPTTYLPYNWSDLLFTFTWDFSYSQTIQGLDQSLPDDWKEQKIKLKLFQWSHRTWISPQEATSVYDARCIARSCPGRFISNSTDFLIQHRHQQSIISVFRSLKLLTPPVREHQWRSASGGGSLLATPLVEELYRRSVFYTV